MHLSPSAFYNPLPGAVTFSSWILLDKESPIPEKACVELLKTAHMNPEVFHLKPHPLISWLPFSLGGLKAFRTKGGGLTPPWPDFVLGAGRLGTAAAALIKKSSPKKTFSVCFNKPKVPLNAFDLIISTAQEFVAGDNVLSTTGAFSALTPMLFKEAAHLWWDELRVLPQPWVAIFIGNMSSQGRFSASATESLFNHVTRLAQKTGSGLMVYCLPNLPPYVIQGLENILAPYPHYLWKGKMDGQDNMMQDPYMAFLGMADYLIGPEDSHCLLTDFLATDKPLYYYPSLTGTPLKNTNFLNTLRDLGAIRAFDGKIEFWSRTFFSETQKVADTLLARMAARG